MTTCSRADAGAWFNYPFLTRKERDNETGLDYFGARYYSSQGGRFTSSDPGALKYKHLADPQDLNRYAYVANNPLKFLDPDGKEKVVIVVRTFIPRPTVKVPYPNTRGSRTFEGDNRKAGEHPERYRMQQVITIETDRSKNGGCSVCPLSSSEAKTGVTRELFPDGSKKEGQAGTDGMRGAAIYTMAGSDHITATAVGSAGNPLVGMAPPITYDVNVGISADKNGDLNVSVDGTHSGFPAIEISVQRPESKDKSEQIITSYSPEDENRGGFSLYSTMPIEATKKLKKEKP